VRIPASVKLEGHSDADAVAHAITDAILGAAGEGDIGSLFPDTDVANKRRNSIEMLSLAAQRIASHGFVVVNVDVTVILESPRVGPHRSEMRERIAEALGISPDVVSVKGKTNEGMGWIGKGEGLACIAVATITDHGS
jgi:2-C-methyl-D-erythritol 2,4-cyclodiphosphate synthase